MASIKVTSADHTEYPVFIKLPEVKKYVIIEIRIWKIFGVKFAIQVK